MTAKNNRRGVYILPSLFTTAGLFFGFYAIIHASLGDFGGAAVAILIAMITDGLDGRVARLTNTTSEFGKEYDSLVDLIAFGLAPSLVLYFWSLQYLGKTGWLISFVYAAATALRLARFNTVDTDEKRYFFGLPSPAAAAFVTFWVWSMHEFEVQGSKITIISALIVVFAALMMVSSIKYRSFKDFDAKHKVPFVVLLGVVFIFVFISFDPPRVLFLMAAAFALSGPVVWLLRLRKGEEKWENIIENQDEPDAETDGTDSKD
ncbi:MAG: CDP-diacylglycerol--serine O-phosphatidyltransferase [Arenicellales bacterium]